MSKKAIVLVVSLLAVLAALYFARSVSVERRKRENDRLISNWKACDVHTTSIYVARGGAGQARLEWQQKHTLSVIGSEGPGAGMTDEDLRTCLMMKEERK